MSVKIRIGNILFLSLILATMGCIYTEQNGAAPSFSTAAVSPPAQSSDLITLNLSINYGDHAEGLELVVNKGMSVLEAFERAASLSVKRYPFGSYVYEINGLRENSGNSGKYWQYYVNGKIAMVAADKFILQSDARLEFRYETQNPEIR